MNLTHKESDLVFSIMRQLSAPMSHSDVRCNVGKALMQLLDAEYFASYVWNEASQKFDCGININMSVENLGSYEDYYQYHDPITPTLQKRRRATAVSEVMSHRRLGKTEFFNDFLAKDGLCFGINFFAWDRGKNIGDLRIWRPRGSEDFSRRDVELVNAIAPSIVNALVRAQNRATGNPTARFSSQPHLWTLTDREAVIADLIVAGRTDIEICQQLHISKPTVRTHVGAILRKTDSERRSMLFHRLLEKYHH